MIHTSVNVRGIWEYQIHGSVGLIEYLRKVLQAEGHVSYVRKSEAATTGTAQTVESSTSVFIDVLWEVVVEDNPAPIHGGPSTDPMYMLWYHPTGGRAVYVGTVNSITLVIAIISTTAEFS